jgi:hypothetical protein
MVTVLFLHSTASDTGKMMLLVDLIPPTWPHPLHELLPRLQVLLRAGRWPCSDAHVHALLQQSRHVCKLISDAKLAVFVHDAVSEVASLHCHRPLWLQAELILVLISRPTVFAPISIGGNHP